MENRQMRKGFLIADKRFADWELTKMGFYDLLATREEALEHIGSEVAPDLREDYEVREVRNGKLLKRDQRGEG